mmetsp:Transcript_55775/g.76790  ORF Transcript_55775/g.76790 Transcript_55775/m.76790 type:complete len:118 (-) Transcript_55775:41-394(-)
MDAAAAPWAGLPISMAGGNIPAGARAANKAGLSCLGEALRVGPKAGEAAPELLCRSNEVMRAGIGGGGGMLPSVGWTRVGNACADGRGGEGCAATVGGSGAARAVSDGGGGCEAVSD